MAKETLASLKADKARLEKELSLQKERFIANVRDYEAGC